MTDQLTRQIHISLKPIQEYLVDEEVTDIIIIGYDRVVVKREGRSIETIPGCGWETEEDLKIACNQVARSMERPLSSDTPLLDARLPDGSRINIVYPPCHNQNGPCVSIRRFPKERLDKDKLIAYGSIDDKGLQILELAVLLGKNILVSGGTGSGKTTLLNIIASFIPKNSRVISIEDSKELNIDHPFWTALESKQRLYENDVEVSMARLVQNSLRMFPRWVILGEVRGPEAWDLMRCFNTGHSGLCTIHSNDAEGALYALENLSLSAVDMRIEPLRQYISRAVSLVCQIVRFPDDSRKITEICEVQGLDYSGGVPSYKLNKLYSYTVREFDGKRMVGNHEVCNRASFADDLFKFNMKMPEFWKMGGQGAAGPLGV